MVTDAVDMGVCDRYQMPLKLGEVVRSCVLDFLKVSRQPPSSTMAEAASEAERASKACQAV